MIAERSRRTRPPEQIWDVAEICVGVADVEQSLGGAWGGADDLEAQTFLALEVLDGLDVIAVAGDEHVGSRAVGEAHHVDDYPDVPVALVRNRLLAFGREGFVHDERLGAHLVAKLVEVVDKGAGAGGSAGSSAGSSAVVRLLLLDDVEGGAQELAVANSGGQEDAVIEDALVVALYGVVEVRPVDEDRDLFHCVRTSHDSHNVRMLPEKETCKDRSVTVRFPRERKRRRSV